MLRSRREREQPMPISKDPELARLQDLALAARQRLERLSQGFDHDSEVVRRAKDIWLEAKVAASDYPNRRKPGAPLSTLRADDDNDV
jgi:hypothetical protein